MANVRSQDVPGITQIPYPLKSASLLEPQKVKVAKSLKVRVKVKEARTKEKAKQMIPKEKVRVTKERKEVKVRMLIREKDPEKIDLQAEVATLLHGGTDPDLPVVVTPVVPLQEKTDEIHAEIF